MKDILTKEDVKELKEHLEIFKLERCCSREEDKEVDDLIERFDNTIIHMIVLDNIAKSSIKVVRAIKLLRVFFGSSKHQMTEVYVLEELIESVEKAGYRI